MRPTQIPIKPPILESLSEKELQTLLEYLLDERFELLQRALMKKRADIVQAHFSETFSSPDNMDRFTHGAKVGMYDLAQEIMQLSDMIKLYFDSVKAS